MKEECQILEQPIKVGKSNIEGGCDVSSVKMLKQTPLRKFLVILLSILTCGLFLLLLKWSFRLRLLTYYKKHSDIRGSTHFLVLNGDGVSEIHQMRKVFIRNLKTREKEEWIGFENRKLTYVLHKLRDNELEFRAVEYPICEIPFSKIAQRKYLLDEEVIELRSEYGKCEKKIKIPSIFEFFLEEMTSPFYLLQYASVIIWMLQTYFQFAIIIICVQLSISIFSYIMTRIFLLKLNKMGQIIPKLTVFRADCPGGKIISSSDVVVGDLIQLVDKMTLPCDCLLVSGELLMNEVSLTGESFPIPKAPVNAEDENCFDYSQSDHKVSYLELFRVRQQIYQMNLLFKKYYLFDGTTIFQTKKDKDGIIVAKVVRVGFESFKGQILRSVLYPRPTEFEFVMNSIKFFAGLAIVMFATFFARVSKMQEFNIPTYLYLYRFFDTLTWVVPPFLPIFQSLSLSLSLMRLKNKNIIGVEPKKSLIAGKVTHMCFDKTGTLTTNGIDVIGFYDQNLVKQPSDSKDALKTSNDIHFKLFGTCHGAYRVNGELVGDILDLEMQKFSHFSIETSENTTTKFRARKKECTLDVLQLFEFDSSLQRMSVLVRENGKHYAFLKGAPERVRELCDPTTIPEGFNAQLNKLSLKGLRVLGLSFREVDPTQEDVNSLQRNELEKNLQFLGFLVLENKLKDDTAECIQRLLEANVECKIISGDSPLTTIQTATECGILDAQQEIFLLDVSSQQNTISMQKIENEIVSSLPYNDNEVIKHLVSTRAQIALTGSVLDYFEAHSKKFNPIFGTTTKIQENRSQETAAEEDSSLQQTQKLNASTYFDFLYLFAQVRVFARMRPEQKRRIIELLQKHNFKVGMIGDGSNDCEAIKQADIGISFASADAALTAPFSSNDESIKCVELILADGRATMVNNIEIFRCIVIQGALKFFGTHQFIIFSSIFYLSFKKACMILVEQALNYGDFQYTFLSFMSGMPMLGLFCLSRPAKKLSRAIPDDCFQKLPNIASISSQLIIQTIAMIIAAHLLINESWHSPNTQLKSINGTLIYEYEGELNSIIMLMTVLFFMSSGWSLYISTPFKMRIYRNQLLSIFILFMAVYCIIMMIIPGASLEGFFISPSLFEHRSFMNILIIISLSACALSTIIEEFVIKIFIAPRFTLLNKSQVYDVKNIS